MKIIMKKIFKMRSSYTKLKSMRLKFLIFTIVLLLVYLFVFYVILMEVLVTQKRKPSTTSSVVLPYVVIHLDFKGSPPKLSYLESLLPKLKDLGVNGLLMEYEDMFPYIGQLVNISARNCYKKSELSNFLAKAFSAGFEIIPLIQTFGHMEHVLKLEQFQPLREIPMYPDSICPSKVESINIIRQMLEQVIEFHEDIFQLNYIHIGCDEVYHINKCYECVQRGHSKTVLYFNHLDTISAMVHKLSPDTKVLIWDDMLHGIKPGEWNELGHFNGIEPVYWNYQPSPSISHIDLMNYHNKFNNIWIATAFKGADGRTALIPNLKSRFFNHYSFLNFIVDYKFGGENIVYNFKGIILTGWSRYSHMDPPCELLPVSLPSLILNLLLIRKFKAGVVVNDDHISLDFDKIFKKFVDDEFRKTLKCRSVDMNSDDYSSCDFESQELNKAVKELVSTRRNVKEAFSGDQFSLDSVEYYAKNNYINMNNVEYHKIWCDKTLLEIKNVEIKLYKAMSKYYDKYFIEEFINFNTYAIKTKLNNVMKFLNTYLKNRSWKRRPANNNISLPTLKLNGVYFSKYFYLQ